MVQVCVLVISSALIFFTLFILRAFMPNQVKIGFGFPQPPLYYLCYLQNHLEVEQTSSFLRLICLQYFRTDASTQGVYFLLRLERSKLYKRLLSAVRICFKFTVSANDKVWNNEGVSLLLTDGFLRMLASPLHIFETGA